MCSRLSFHGPGPGPGPWLTEREARQSGNLLPGQADAMQDGRTDGLRNVEAGAGETESRRRGGEGRGEEGAKMKRVIVYRSTASA